MFEEEIKDLIISRGGDKAGFCFLGEAAPKDFPEYKYAVTIVKKLSKAVMKTITDRPGIIYFQHYRAVNAKLDSIAVDVSDFIEEKGFFALPIAASQSMPGKKYSGVFQHKTAACKSGMGFIGKNCLVITEEYGPCVRFATVLTDMPLENSGSIIENGCGNCNACVSACPAGAVSANGYKEYSPEKCSEYMKNFRDEGRGAVCGLCMKKCRYTVRYIEGKD